MTTRSGDDRPDVPVADLRSCYEAHADAYDAAALRALRSGWYVLGEEVERFERDFAAFSGSRRCVGVASGTDAVELALRALGVGPGDAVFTVSHTAVATAVGIERAGATPIFVDVRRETMNMDPDLLERAVARLRVEVPQLRPAAVVPVHLYGLPAQMEPILRIAAREDLLVVEDCAQAHGARVGNQPVGTLGAAAAYSFYPTKNLGAFGDAGLVCTQDVSTDGALRALRQYGWEERYVSARRGVNSRLDEIQAALLQVRLTHLEADNARRRSIADAYRDGLAGVDLTLPPVDPEGGLHVYHQFVIRSARRDELRARLADRGIGTAVLYPLPVHRQPAYADSISADWPLGESERAAVEVLALPMGPHLSEDHVTRVINEVRAVAGRRQ